tara:strand:- start:30 stop:1028 length:999 start_codon:yes stop_codon:yes gene_type:complete
MKRVFVSGGSGYIAMYCIKILLNKGYQVITSVREEEKIHLVKDSLSKNNVNHSNLEFCILNLLKDEGWDEALKNCDFVIHMASPVIPGDVDYDILVKPAFEGMNRCLNSAIKNGVKKFVLTSSFAAIYGNSKTEYNDNDWTDLSDKTHMPYVISKTKAEKGMWDIIENTKSKIDACAINPVLVLGPSMTGILSMSNRLTIKKLFKLPFIPNLSISIVGVNDVADAHVKAMENANSKGKRFLLSEKTINLNELCKILKKSGFNKVPSFTIPNLILKFIAFFTPSLRMISKRIGTHEKLHTNNANEILNWYPKSVDKEIVDSAKQLYRTGVLKK